ncbi:MAG: porin family protein [Ginsengibacter sp.]|nr:porin family protein [Hanamia sp.]
MKTKIIIAAILVFFSFPLFSQGLTFGIKAGANMGKITGRSFKDAYKLGYHAGAFVTIGGKKLALQPEILFNQVNTDTATSFSQITGFNNVSSIKLHYLSIPIMINYNLANILALQFGPQFGILMDKNKNLVQNGKDAFKSGDFALAAGLQLKLLKFRVYGRFVGGTTDLNNLGSNDTWKVNAIQLGVGLAL